MKQLLKYLFILLLPVFVSCLHLPGSNHLINSVDNPREFIIGKINDYGLDRLKGELLEAFRHCDIYSDPSCVVLRDYLKLWNFTEFVTEEGDVPSMEYGEITDQRGYYFDYIAIRVGTHRQYHWVCFFRESTYPDFAFLNLKPISKNIYIGSREFLHDNNIFHDMQSRYMPYLKMTDLSLPDAVSELKRRWDAIPCAASLTVNIDKAVNLTNMPKVSIDGTNVFFYCAFKYLCDQTETSLRMSPDRDRIQINALMPVSTESLTFEINDDFIRLLKLPRNPSVSDIEKTLKRQFIEFPQSITVKQASNAGKIIIEGFPEDMALVKALFAIQQ